MTDEIKTKPPTQEYKDGWDRIFGSKPATKSDRKKPLQTNGRTRRVSRRL